MIKKIILEFILVLITVLIVICGYFLIIDINGLYYILLGKDIIDFIDNNDRKSIPYDYIKEKGYIIELTLKPVLNYLKVLDKICFKGEI